MTARGLVPCAKCGELHSGCRPPEIIGKALLTLLRRAKDLHSDNELEFLRVHVGLAAAELEGICLNCGWARVADERHGEQMPAMLSVVDVGADPEPEVGDAG